MKRRLFGGGPRIERRPVSTRPNYPAQADGAPISHEAPTPHKAPAARVPAVFRSVFDTLSPVVSRVSRVLLPSVFALFTLVCVLFALGVLPPPVTSVEGLLDSHGNAYTGEMRTDIAEFVGPVSITFANGDTYQGELAQGRFVGKGSYTSAQGWTLAGTFRDGRLSGEGSYSDHRGIYKGWFENSLPEGIGVYRCVDGWSYSGVFKQGSLTGDGTITAFVDPSSEEE